MDAKSGKYLTFNLHTEEYGVEILMVREIVGYVEANAMPQAASYVKGVINLRGQVIPIIDLRLKFGMPEAEVTEKTCIIVIEAKSAKKLVGVVVDGVSEVVDLPEETIDPTPDLGHDVDQTMITGMAKTEKGIIILLNVCKVLFDADIPSEFDNEILTMAELEE